MNDPRTINSPNVVKITHDLSSSDWTIICCLVFFVAAVLSQVVPKSIPSNEKKERPVMTASELITLIRKMNNEERREFGIALEECGVSVVLTKRLTTPHKSTATTMIASETERRPWIDTHDEEVK